MKNAIRNGLKNDMLWVTTYTIFCYIENVFEILLVYERLGDVFAQSSYALQKGK